MDYRSAHKNIQKSRGKASEYRCVGCRKPAKDWAYQYPEGVVALTDPKGRLYSLDPSDYAPMCFGCHVTHDRAKEQRLRDIVAGNARRSSAELAERRKVDPALDERMKAASRRNLALGRSPEQARRAGVAGGAATLRRRAEDPALVERMREVSARNGHIATQEINTRRVTCADCGRRSTPGPMARHFKASGHQRKE